MKLCPTDDEADTLRKYNGDPNDLGKAEQFFLKLMTIPDLRDRLHCFVYKREFESITHDILSDIEMVDSAISELREAHRFKKILEYILALGNYMVMYLK